MTASILNHPTRFDGDARIRLANMRLMNAMAAVQSNLEQFVQERDWRTDAVSDIETELDRVYQEAYREACELENRSIALLSESREPPKAG